MELPVLSKQKQDFLDSSCCFSPGGLSFTWDHSSELLEHEKSKSESFTCGHDSITTLDLGAFQMFRLG